MMTVDTLNSLCEYRVNLVRGSVGLRQWKVITVHASDPDEAFEKALSKQKSKDWRLSSIRMAVVY